MPDKPVSKVTGYGLNGWGSKMAVRPFPPPRVYVPRHGVVFVLTFTKLFCVHLTG